MATVLQVAYPFAPVSSDAVGGAEQIVATLDAALTARGHRSLVVACAGSRVTGTLVAIPSVPGLIDERAREATHSAVRETIARTLASTDVDVVHLHGIDFDAYVPAGVRAMVTLHLPIAWYRPRAFAAPATFVCVSPSQRRTCPVPALTIENGVDVRAFRARRLPGRYALALGRICPEKGLDRALDAASAAAVPLFVGGQTFGYETHLRYFEQELLPRLRPPHRWLGAVAGERKRRLLAGARCVLIPSRAAETSSLVAMEAFAAGTPVIAHPAGALADLVEHGRTGWLVDSVAEMAAAIERVPELSRQACRATAEARLSSERMIDAYLSLYVARARPARPRPPRPSAAIVDSIEGLSRLAPEWTELWTRAPAATVFSRPEWLLAWCRHLARQGLLAVVVRDRGKLVALVPFVVHEGVVTLAGGEVTDYRDALVEPTYEPLVADMVADVLDRLRCRCTIGDLPASSWLVRALRGSEPAERDQVCPTLALPAANPLQALPLGFARRLAYARRRAAREGFTVEDLRAHTSSELLDALFTLHAARWQRRGQAGVLADPAIERFHREAAAGLARARLLAMHGLRDANGRIVAVSYGFVTRDRGALYASGFDPAFAARSPGALVIARAIEAAHEAGARRYDFLRGGEAYKYEWGARDEWTMRRVWRGGAEHACAAP